MTIPVKVAKAMPTEVNVAAFWLPPVRRSMYKVATVRMVRLMMNDVSRRTRLLVL